MTSDDRGIKFLDKEKYNIKIMNVPKISNNIFLLPIEIISLIGLIFKSIFFLKRVFLIFIKKLITAYFVYNNT